MAVKKKEMRPIKNNKSLLLYIQESRKLLEGLLHTYSINTSVLLTINSLLTKVPLYLSNHRHPLQIVYLG